jgi:hypothetical protein
MGEETSVHCWDSRAGCICTTSPHKMKFVKAFPHSFDKIRSQLSVTMLNLVLWIQHISVFLGYLFSNKEIIS